MPFLGGGTYIFIWLQYQYFAFVHFAVHPSMFLLAYISAHPPIDSSFLNGSLIAVELGRFYDLWASMPTCRRSWFLLIRSCAEEVTILRLFKALSACFALSQVPGLLSVRRPVQTVTELLGLRWTFQPDVVWGDTETVVCLCFPAKYITDSSPSIYRHFLSTCIWWHYKWKVFIFLSAEVRTFRFNGPAKKPPSPLTWHWHSRRSFDHGLQRTLLGYEMMRSSAGRFFLQERNLRRHPPADQSRALTLPTSYQRSIHGRLLTNCINDYGMGVSSGLRQGHHLSREHTWVMRSQMGRGSQSDKKWRLTSFINSRYLWWLIVSVWHTSLRSDLFNVDDLRMGRLVRYYLLANPTDNPNLNR